MKPIRNSNKILVINPEVMMKKVIWILAAVIGCFAACDRVEDDYDIVIYGGTPGGFIAAIQAATQGKSVALIEPTFAVGGIW